MYHAKLRQFQMVYGYQRNPHQGSLLAIVYNSAMIDTVYLHQALPQALIQVFRL